MIGVSLVLTLTKGNKFVNNIQCCFLVVLGWGTYFQCHVSAGKIYTP